MKKVEYPGINIQYPISQKILSGEKIIETRTYPIPKKYLAKEMAIVETPGKIGNFKARIVAIVRFDECFVYESSAHFYRDKTKHCVDKNSPWAWTDTKPKWGWRIKVVKVLQVPITLRKSAGIRFTKSISI